MASVKGASMKRTFATTVEQQQVAEQEKENGRSALPHPECAAKNGVGTVVVGGLGWKPGSLVALTRPFKVREESTLGSSWWSQRLVTHSAKRHKPLPSRLKQQKLPLLPVTQ
jgi:hypothetical protein